MTTINRFPAAMAPLARRRVRRGFSLVELLVVIAIMALLAALITAAIQRSRLTQIRRNSEATVAKVQSGVDLHVRAITDQVAIDQRNNTADFQMLRTYCDGDASRAVALLTYCRVKQAFPQSAAEVALPGFSVGGVNFPRSPAFAQLATIAGNADDVSAALLYAALTNRTIGGTNFGSDEGLGNAQGEITLGPVTAKIFTDGWKKPVAFRRWHESAELNGPDYANPNDPYKNAFDPKGRLAGWTTNPPNRTAAEAALGAGNAFPAFTFTNNNKSLVVFSGGVNERFDNLTGDDILGFKLRAVGKRGAP